jgi:hypothetical protein
MSLPELIVATDVLLLVYVIAPILFDDALTGKGISPKVFVIALNVLKVGAMA